VNWDTPLPVLDLRVDFVMAHFLFGAEGIVAIAYIDVASR
jgi:hypothetical protein